MTNEPQLLPPTELALQVPQEVTTISSGSDLILTSAQECVVDSEPSFQLADEIQAQLKAEAKQINEKRMEFTRPLDSLKEQWVKFFCPAVNAREQAVRIYQQKMSTFRAQERQKALLAQQEAERVLREQKERQEAEARKLEAKAASLKTPSRANELMREADDIRQAAAMMPESVALAVSAPATVASSVSEPWIVESFTDVGKFLHWLADHPEWHFILNLRTDTRAVNRFADQCHVLEIPGVKFKQKDVYRSKSR